VNREFELPYGRSIVRAAVPKRNLSFVLETEDVQGAENEADLILQSLRSPIEHLPLRESVHKHDHIAVIVTDNTRACPDDRLLPPILAELEAVVPRQNITIIVALGLHPPLSRGELAALLGEEITREYNVLNHDPGQTVYLGDTCRGTPVEINSRVVEADFRLSTGFIEPHFFAGFSGGRKSIAPGVFSLKSAYKNHGYKMIEHRGSRAGVLKGNPIHEDMVEQARMARLDFIVNVLLNKKREITHVVAGDPVRAHEIGCEMEKKIAGVRVNHKVDIVITTNSGAPLDLDLYQSVKGMDNASLIIRDGGIIIMASSCSFGVGPAAFRELHTSASSAKQILQKIRRDEPMGVQWQNQILARIQLRNDVYLLSDIEDNVVSDMMITPIATVDEGLARAFEVLGDDAEVAVIPEGPLLLPLLEGQPFG
jgi:nickel-dependent lactate racemase